MVVACAGIFERNRHGGQLCGYTAELQSLPCAARFLRRFYTIFTARDERIASKFADTDWGMQIYLLRHGISASLMYATGSDLGGSEVSRLVQSHSRKGYDIYDIPAWLYGEWLEALIAAIWETDTQMNDRLEQRRRAAVKPATDAMIKGS